MGQQELKSIANEADSRLACTQSGHAHFEGLYTHCCLYLITTDACVASANFLIVVLIDDAWMCIDACAMG